MKQLLCNVSMIVCIFSGMNVHRSYAQPCSECQSTCSGGASANGDCSFAAVEGATADGDYSAAIGYKNSALGTHSLVLGHVIQTSSGSQQNMTIGTGIISTNDLLINSISNSIMMGMNSTLPTVFIEGSSGAGTWGNVGIGTTAPIGLLHLRDESGASNELVLEKYDNTLARLRFQQGTSFLGHLTMDDAEDMLMTNRTNNRNIAFWINQSSTQTEAMRIVGSTANVGIGTTAPGARLHVRADPAGFEQFLHLTVNDAALPDTSNYLRIMNNTAVNDELGFRIEARNSNSTTVPALTLNGVLDQSVDAGSTAPVMTFNVRKVNTSGSIANRPLFSWHNDGSARMRMDATGNLGIGTTTPSGKLHVNGTVFANLSTTTSNPPMGPGNPVKILSTGELIEYTSTAHHKTEVQNIQFDKEAFLSLRPVDFRWREAYGGGADVGLIAEEVEELMPNMVNYHYKHVYTDENTGEMLRDSMGIPVIDSTQMQAWGVDYHKVVIYLLALAKEQDSALTALTERVIQSESLMQDCCGSGAAHRLSDPESASKTTEASAQLKVYPNPNDGNFTVEYSCVEGSSARLVLVTLTGERIHLADNLKGTGREEFSISGASGLYQVVLESHKGRVLKNMKVIVAR